VRGLAETPLKRMSRPEENAGTVAWLLSSTRSGVTGQGIEHNNGAYLRRPETDAAASTS
jgi:NAD(P)-dependent dehydrogenase (short-subunit alcohol dehydrogenase family)